VTSEVVVRRLVAAREALALAEAAASAATGPFDIRTPRA
jgi:hypothetical protein